MSDAVYVDDQAGPPGGHPHADRPNWQPGDDDADDLLTQKIADAMRDGKSERHMAKLLGIPRTALHSAMRQITGSRAKTSEGIPIGEMSRLTGVNIETIRYYERIKMLQAPDASGPMCSWHMASRKWR